jgi:transcriptional regulator with XRE-family HTH domain
MQQPFVAVTALRRLCNLPLPMVERRKKAPPPREILYPEFAARLDELIRRYGLKNDEIAKAIGLTKGEMVRRYREGWDMPRKDKMKRLAALLGTTPAQLQWGGAPTVPGVANVPILGVSPEEQMLIESYRRMSPAARKMLRARAAELLEEFSPPSQSNPFGKGTQ